MERQEALLHAIKSAKTDTGAYNVIADSLGIMTDHLRECRETTARCKSEITGRVQKLEYILIGTDGENGVRAVTRETMKRVDTLEDRLSVWITRATTALILTQVVILPLLLWAFTHVFKP